VDRTGNVGSLTLVGEELRVSGTSSGLDGCELVSRNVAVRQNGHLIQGPTNVSLTWTAVIQDAATAGFEVGDADALALGCETYLDRENTIDALPAFVTFTWSQIIKIT
jgi:hypothetical protein